jgi:hypothetical protein
VIEEGGRLQHPLDDQADRVGEAQLQGVAPVVVQGHEAGALLAAQGPAEGAQPELGDELAGAGRLTAGRIAGEHGPQVAGRRRGQRLGSAADQLGVLDGDGLRAPEREGLVPIVGELLAGGAHVAQQIADGVVVLADGQPPQRHQPRGSGIALARRRGIPRPRAGAWAWTGTRRARRGREIPLGSGPDPPRARGREERDD